MSRIPTSEQYELSSPKYRKQGKAKLATKKHEDMWKKYIPPKKLDSDITLPFKPYPKKKKR